MNTLKVLVVCRLIILSHCGYESMLALGLTRLWGLTRLTIIYRVIGVTGFNEVMGVKEVSDKMRGYWGYWV